MPVRVVFALGLLIFAGCRLTDDPTDITMVVPEVTLDMSTMPAQRIGAYNLFKDVRRQIPNDGLVPYDLNTPHFADYATLHRFVWVPPDMRIRFDKNLSFQYPTNRLSSDGSSRSIPP